MFKQRWLVVGFALFGVALLAAACTIATPTVEPGAMTEQTTDMGALPAGDATRGQYVFALAWGCGCHFNADLGGLAGGREFSGPFGTVYARNLTSDEETGLGGWTDQQIADAIRLGKRHDGEQLAPAMPYRVYAGMSDQDVADLVAFLRTLPPIRNEVGERSLAEAIPAFEPQTPPPAVSPTDPVERGSYIVNSLARCSGCHSGRAADGSLMYLAGNYNANTQVIYPNITPHEETGIGLWTEEQIVTLLQTGVRPDGTEVLAPMINVLNGGFKNITDDDALAVAAFLKSIPAIENDPGP